MNVLFLSRLRTKTSVRKDEINSGVRVRHCLSKQRIWISKYSLLGAAAPKTPNEKVVVM